MHLLSQVAILLHFLFENIKINEHKGNLINDFGMGIHEEIFPNKIHFENADSTMWEVYFERKSKAIFFLGKKKEKREGSCFSTRLICLSEFRKNKIFFKIKVVLVSAIRKCSLL